MPFIPNGGFVPNGYNGNGNGEPEPPTTRLPATSFYYLEDGREIFVVAPEVFDVTEVSLANLEVLFYLRIVYFRMAEEDQYGFSIWVYNYLSVGGLTLIEQELLDDLGIDPEDPETKLKKWLIDLKYKLQEFMKKFKWILIGGIVIGSIVAVLVGFQYSKAYVTQKGVEKAKA